MLREFLEGTGIKTRLETMITASLRVSICTSSLRRTGTHRMNQNWYGKPVAERSSPFSAAFSEQLKEEIRVLRRDGAVLAASVSGLFRLFIEFQ